MTNNYLPKELTETIDERVQMRDVEKMFDTFIENLTDTLIEELDLTDDDEINASLDYIIEATMKRFNYHLKN